MGFKKSARSIKSNLMSRIERPTLLLLTLLLLGFGSAAQAILVKQFSYTGRVVSTGLGVPGVEISDTITGLFAYDLDTLPNSFGSSPDLQSYNGALDEFTYKAGDYEVELANPSAVTPFNFLTITNDRPTGLLGLRDQFVVGGLMDGAGPVPAINATINLIGSTGTFHNLTIPDFLALEAFSAASISLSVELPGGTRRTITGEITTLNQVSAVPLPAAVYFLSSALVSLGVFRRVRLGKG